MGLFESISGQLLSKTLGGQQQNNVLSSVLGLINSPGTGGIGGLAQKFQAAGLGHIVQGWIGNGPNPPVSAGQVQQVLGADQIKAFAQQSGLPIESAAQHLAELLPHVVDHLTPNGTVPTGGINVSSVLGALKSHIFGS